MPYTPGTGPKEKRERNAEIVRLREAGATYDALARQFGLTRGRVANIMLASRRRAADDGTRHVHHLRVTVRTRSAMSAEDVAGYVHDAIGCWGGQLFPGYVEPYPYEPPDPLFPSEHRQRVRCRGVDIAEDDFDTFDREET